MNGKLVQTGGGIAISLWCVFQCALAITTDIPSAVSAAEVIRWQSQGDPFVFIDLRQSAEFTMKHARGAMNMPSFGVDSTPISLPKEARIVLCGAGPESTEAVSAVQALRAKGYAHAFVLEGGLSSWEANGLPIMVSTGPSPAHFEDAISAEELAHLIDQGAPLTVIDVRPTATSDTNRIPNAVGLAPAAVLASLGSTAKSIDFIVVVDEGEGAARNQAEELRRKGFLGAKYLSGGMPAWNGRKKNENQPIGP